MQHLKRSPLVYCLIAVLVLTLGVHGLWVKRFFGDPNAIYEGPGRTMGGDAVYYLDGALSLYQLDPALKFNGKKEPILGKTREINESDFPGWAKYAMAAYPYPSFKFGYSLLAAIVTLPFPQHIFVRDLPRMAVANIIFNALLAAMIFLYGWSASRRLLGGLIPAFLVILDYSNIHNSYGYMSHTTSGLLLFFAALALLTSVAKIGYFRFGSIAFILVFSGFTSSHLFIQAAVVGLLAWLRTMIQASGMRERLLMTAAGVVGAAITPAYVLGIEEIFQFSALGLPTFLAQLEGYSSIIKRLVATFPWYARQMWDLRLFNPFALFIVGTVVLGILALWALHWRQKGLFRWRLSVGKGGGRRAVEALIADPIWLLFLALLVGLLVSAIYSLPITRAMVAHLVLGEVLLGMWLARMVTANRWIGLSVTAIVLAFSTAGDELIWRASPTNVVSPWRKLPSDVLFVYDQEVVGHLRDEYYKHMGKWVVPRDRYEYINKSVKELLAQIDRDWPRYFPNLPRGDFEHAWVAFDAMELVTTYSSTRRFWKEFTPLKENLVTGENYKTDFRLIDDLFKIIQQGGLGEVGAFKVRKFAWHFATWDQEYNYTLGYIGSVRPLLADTAFWNIDLRAVYYFNVGAIRRAISSGNAS